MKKGTKQEFINLLERVFNEADFDLGELKGYLDEQLEKYNGKSNPYLAELRNLQQTLINYFENNIICEPEVIYSEIQKTINFLNTSIRELKEQEAAKQRELELEQYHKELPLRLLELLAEAHHLDIEYKVWNPHNKNIEVVLYEPYYNEVGLYKGTNEVEVKLDGQPWEYHLAEGVIKSAKERLEEEQRKAKLIAAAKAKLTDEEKKALGID